MGNVATHPSGKLNGKPSGTCVVCDDCGRVFTVSQEITSGTDKRKRCERLAGVCNPVGILPYMHLYVHIDVLQGYVRRKLLTVPMLERYVFKCCIIQYICNGHD